MHSTVIVKSREPGYDHPPPLEPPPSLLWACATKRGGAGNRFPGSTITVKLTVILGHTSSGPIPKTVCYLKSKLKKTLGTGADYGVTYSTVFADLISGVEGKLEL